MRAGARTTRRGEPHRRRDRRLAAASPARPSLGRGRARRGPSSSGCWSGRSHRRRADVLAGRLVSVRHVRRSGCHEQQAAILAELRLPRVVLAGLVGAALWPRGAAYQGVFRNPLADPYLLGAAAGAGLGATIADRARRRRTRSPLAVPLAAFVGALGGVGLAYVLGRSSLGAGRTTASLILAGVAVAGVPDRGADLLQQQQRRRRSAQVYSWILGRLATAGWDEVRLALPSVASRVGDPAGSSGGSSTCSRSATTRPRASASTSRAIRADRRGRGVARHRGRGRGHRADRLRRASIVPHTVRLLAGAQLPGDPAAVGAVRRGVPDPAPTWSPAPSSRRPRSRSASSPRSSARRSSSLVLRRPEGGVRSDGRRDARSRCADSAVALGRRPILRDVALDVAGGRVGVA